MNLIIYVSSRIRHAQAVRHPDFSYSERHGKYLYGGRELSQQEFNEAAERVFSEKYLTKGFTFAPAVVESAEVPPAPEPAPEPVTPPEAPDIPAETAPSPEPPAPAFRSRGRAKGDGFQK